MTETTIGPYLVLGKLGEGGMGEVYRFASPASNDSTESSMPLPL